MRTWAFCRVDLILAGLDNCEARLRINRWAWKNESPWIDGAIEGINGVARVFLPSTLPCYKCTLGEVDWQLLEQRMSCNLLLRGTNVEGKVPTTLTISSIIAGIQVQEAVKLVLGSISSFEPAVAPAPESSLPLPTPPPPLPNTGTGTPPPPMPTPRGVYAPLLPAHLYPVPQPKKRVRFILLAIFLGMFGAHNFYASTQKKRLCRYASPF